MDSKDIRQHNVFIIHNLSIPSKQEKTTVHVPPISHGIALASHCICCSDPYVSQPPTPKPPVVCHAWPLGTRPIQNSSSPARYLNLNHVCPSSYFTLSLHKRTRETASKSPRLISPHPALSLLGCFRLLANNISCSISHRASQPHLISYMTWVPHTWTQLISKLASAHKYPGIIRYY